MSHEASCAGAGRVAARLAKQVERALGEVDLSLAQFRLLANLSEGPSAASALAERLIVSRPSVTALADGLVERGLVERRQAAGDRRSVIHVLTDKGSRVVADADVAIDGRLASVAEELAEGEQKRAFAGLRSWEKALDRARDRVMRDR
ncbi:MAG: MarR family winged helix-turn-helix transcriptional regulator [Actinomycetota bacterium]